MLWHLQDSTKWTLTGRDPKSADTSRQQQMDLKRKGEVKKITRNCLISKYNGRVFQQKLLNQRNDFLIRIFTLGTMLQSNNSMSCGHFLASLSRFYAIIEFKDFLMKCYDQTNEYKYSLFYESQAWTHWLFLRYFSSLQNFRQYLSYNVCVFTKNSSWLCKNTNISTGGKHCDAVFSFHRFFSYSTLESVIALCSYFEFSWNIPFIPLIKNSSTRIITLVIIKLLGFLYKFNHWQNYNNIELFPFVCMQTKGH